MIPERATLKKYARSILQDIWPGAVGALIIYYLINIVLRWSIGLFNGLFGVLVSVITTLFVTLPMYLGVSRYFLLSSRKQKATMQDLFSWYKYRALSKSVAAGIWRGIWYAIWFAIGETIVFGVLMIVLPKIFSTFALQEFLLALFGLLRALLIDDASDIPYYLVNILRHSLSQMQPALAVLLIGAFIAGMIPFFIKIIAYSQYEYILCDNPNISVFRALYMSKIMTSGYKWTTFVWRASFLLWIIATMICGVVGFYTLPYIRLFYALYYNELKKLALKNKMLTSADFGEAYFEPLALPEIPM